MRVSGIIRTGRGPVVFEGPELVDGKVPQLIPDRRIYMRFWPARLACWFMRRLGYAVMFYPDHFGHQCGDVARDLIKKKQKLLYLAGVVPNRALREIHARNATIIDIPSWFKQHLIAADQAHHCMDERISRGLESYNNAKDFGENPKMAFSAAEHDYGRSVLKQLKLEPGKYVCFHARDARYGRLNHPKMFEDRGAVGQIAEDGAAQRHRNMEFSDFFETIRWLQKQGLTAVRLGSDVEKTYEANNLVDYASERDTFDNPDLCDLYLMAHCRMFIGQNTGVQLMSVAYNIPSVLVNWYPYAPFSRPTANTVICRNKRIKRGGITYSEFDSRHLFDFSTWNHFYNVSEELEVINNTPEEILETVQRAMKIEQRQAA